MIKKFYTWQEELIYPALFIAGIVVLTLLFAGNAKQAVPSDCFYAPDKGGNTLCQ
jgi:hypothetical protein